MRSSSAHRGFNAICGDGRVFVLPHEDEAPAYGEKSGCIPPVSVDVPLDLGVPVLAVRSGSDTVIGTAMPEAAETFDGNALSDEHDIGTEADARYEGNMFTEAKTTTVKLATQSDLVSCIPRAVSLHNGPRCLR